MEESLTLCARDNISPEEFGLSASWTNTHILTEVCWF